MIFILVRLHMIRQTHREYLLRVRVVWNSVCEWGHRAGSQSPYEIRDDNVKFHEKSEMKWRSSAVFAQNISAKSDLRMTKVSCFANRCDRNALNLYCMCTMSRVSRCIFCMLWLRKTSNKCDYCWSVENENTLSLPPAVPLCVWIWFTLDALSHNRQTNSFNPIFFAAIQSGLQIQQIIIISVQFGFRLNRQNGNA